MREHFSYLCKDISDHEHKELKADEVLDIFTEHYLNLRGNIEVTDFDFERVNDAVKIDITFRQGDTETELEAEGNGTLSAVNNALSELTGEQYTLQVYTQHSMQGEARAALRHPISDLSVRTAECSGVRAQIPTLSRLIQTRCSAGIL